MWCIAELSALCGSRHWRLRSCLACAYLVLLAPVVAGESSSASVEAGLRSDADGIEVAAQDGNETHRRWFCNHHMPWKECQTHLPTERAALGRFLGALNKTGMPGESDLNGRGIVMSGGPGHVLQALANLDVLRRVHKSNLPVEFWHAYELQDFHCEALAVMGAICRALQVPGVYPLWQTTTPAVLSSSFREVLWLDTDITPLVDPEILFHTETFQREGALFWPDLWGAGCNGFGQSAWPQHIVWHLLELDYDASDHHFTQEHETGHFLVDKVRHWRALCLANYLATRDFFTQVLHGYKDVFRLAWLKLAASNWMSPLRPGLVGGFLRDSRFMPAAMIHFWPAHGELAIGNPEERVPLYVHQKKKPGMLWQDVVTFPEPLGVCTKYKLGFFRVEDVDAELWDVAVKHHSLANSLSVVEQVWNHAYDNSHTGFKSDDRVSEKDLDRLHPPEKQEYTQQFKQAMAGCPCDYGDNRWFALLTGATTGQLSVHLMGCDEILDPELDPAMCVVGFATAALLCSQMLVRSGDLRLGLQAAMVVKQLLPAIETCLPNSFWPLDLADLVSFVGNASEPGDGGGLIFQGKMDMPTDRLQRFPRNLRRCAPLADSMCWQNTRAMAEASGMKWDHHPHNSCLYCCDPNWRHQEWHQECFDEVFSEERCCNIGEQ